MIKVEMNKGCIVKLEVTGNFIDICGESVLLLETIKEGLKKEDEALGREYMRMVKRGIDFFCMDDAAQRDFARDRVQTLITGIEKILEMFPKEG